MITQRRTQLTKNGDRMAFLTLEDLYGSTEVIVFPDTYCQSQVCCESDAPLLVWGKVESEGSEGRIIAQRILPLAEADALREFRQLTLALSPELNHSVLHQVRDILAASQGECEVILAIRFADGENVLLRAAEHLNVTPSMALLDRLENLLGAESVQMA
jgi:DNA polymerase-3 subunit alpha